MAATVNHQQITQNTGSTRIYSLFISADCLPKSTQSYSNIIFTSGGNRLMIRLVHRHTSERPEWWNTRGALTKLEMEIQIMAASNSTRLITNPTKGMFGVSIRMDGTFENVGIGSFDPSQGMELADRLTTLANAIRAKSGQRQEAIRALA